MDAPTDDAPVRRRGVALAPLRHRNFALVWSAGLISNVGTWMETVAVGDLVAGRTPEISMEGLTVARYGSKARGSAQAAFFSPASTGKAAL